MFKPLALFVGLRYTRAQRDNRFVSFIALVSIIGLTLGVAVLDRELKNRILGMIPQATVSSTQILQDWPKIISVTQQHRDIVAAAPFTQLQGMVTAQGQVAGIMINGIEPELEKKVSIIQNHMSAGRLENLREGEFGIVIGASLAEGLGLGLNDKITLVLPEAAASPAGEEIGRAHV